MHSIDLKKYELRTDMVLDDNKELKSNKERKNYVNKGVNVSLVLDDSYSYVTLEFNDITDTDHKDMVSLVFKEELEKYLKMYNCNLKTKYLIVGLGNIKSTPDSLGPLTIEKIITTKHLFDINEVGDNFSCVSAFSPGVTGVSGIETYSYVKGVLSMVKPDILIIVDALSSSSISRVNKSIQISNKGIMPGSGIGNERKELSEKTLGIPVISVGVPTITSASTIVFDTINYMMKNYAYNKENQNKKSYKLITKPVNYLKSNLSINEDDKKTLLGLVGMLSEDELKELIYEVLTPIGYNLMVAPKEVDFLIDNLSSILSFGINNTIHKL